MQFLMSSVRAQPSWAQFRTTVLRETFVKCQNLRKHVRPASILFGFRIYGSVYSLEHMRTKCPESKNDKCADGRFLHTLGFANLTEPSRKLAACVLLN